MSGAHLRAHFHSKNARSNARRAFLGLQPPVTTHLIETRLPIAALGEENVKEPRSMTVLPPSYYLHVCWARALCWPSGELSWHPCCPRTELVYLRHRRIPGSDSPHSTPCHGMQPETEG